MTPMRVAYFGSGAFGLPTLEILCERTEVVGIVSQPARPAGRGGRVSPTPVAAWTTEHRPQTPLLTPEDVNEPRVVEQVHAWGADAWVVVAFGQKLSERLLEGVFAVNLHASRLPRWRGASPIQSAILAGDVETGNSVITLAQRMDAGLILAQSRVAIDPAWTSADLEETLARDGPALVWAVLEAHRRGEAQGRPQDPSLVTRAAKLSRADAWVKFDDTAGACRRRIHGLNPWPGVSVTLNGESIKLLRAGVVERARADTEEVGIGGVVDAAAGTVRCGGGTALRILEVQPAGGRKMSWAEFARGRSINRGDRMA